MEVLLLALGGLVDKRQRGARQRGRRVVPQLELEVVAGVVPVDLLDRVVGLLEADPDESFSPRRTQKSAADAYRSLGKSFTLQ